MNSFTCSEGSFGVGPVRYPSLTFTVELDRKSGYYMLNIVAPCILLMGLVLCVFWLPPESGEKVHTLKTCDYYTKIHHGQSVECWSHLNQLGFDQHLTQKILDQYLKRGKSKVSRVDNPLTNIRLIIFGQCSVLEMKTGVPVTGGPLMLMSNSLRQFITSFMHTSEIEQFITPHVCDVSGVIVLTSSVCVSVTTLTAERTDLNFSMAVKYNIQVKFKVKVKVIGQGHKVKLEFQHGGQV